MSMGVSAVQPSANKSFSQIAKDLKGLNKEQKQQYVKDFAMDCAKKQEEYLSTPIMGNFGYLPLMNKLTDEEIEIANKTRQLPQGIELQLVPAITHRTKDIHTGMIMNEYTTAPTYSQYIKGISSEQYPKTSKLPDGYKLIRGRKDQNVLIVKEEITKSDVNSIKFYFGIK